MGPVAVKDHKQGGHQQCESAGSSWYGIVSRQRPPAGWSPASGISGSSEHVTYSSQRSQTGCSLAVLGSGSSRDVTWSSQRPQEQAELQAGQHEHDQEQGPGNGGS